MPITSPQRLSSGPPELPGIDRRVGLNQRLGQRQRRLRQDAIDAADDAARDGLIQTERIADGDHVFAGTQPIGVAQARDRQRAVLRFGDLDHRDVEDRIGADHARRHDRPSSSVTTSDCSPYTTCELVRIRPLASMMKPEPSTRLTRSCSR